ncbi:hypothetical protein [Mycobacterium bourgelatii]|nr:hypothetical protein [Mycobacterium bourgelatii]
MTTSEQPSPSGDEQPPQDPGEKLDDSAEAQNPDAGLEGKGK